MTTEPGEAPGLPGYEAEPPGPEYTIPLPPPAAPTSTIDTSWVVAIFPLAFGITGLLFNLFGVIAIFLGIFAFRSTGVLGRILSVVGIAFGVAGLIWSIVDVIRTHEIISLIF